MATGSENGERSSIRSEILAHDPYNPYIAGPSENGENSNEDERIRPASTSLSRRARSQIFRGPEKGEESVVDNEFFFIGIDFGTTCTGVAWASPRDPDKVRVIQGWPGGTNPKVPSTIRYKEDGTRNWGFEASTDDPATLQWFKLLLVDDKDMAAEIQSCSYITDAKVALRKVGKEPLDVVRDYLSEVWDYTMKSMHKHLGSEVIDSLPFRVVVTAPATWSKSGKAYARLEQAAEQAGIRKPRPCGVTDLRIVSEPEAAAFATMIDAHKDRVLETDDIFVVCDAGGGTVDLVTYKMVDRENMVVDECAIGDGGVCGSIFLDQSMEKWLTTWFGKRWTSLSEQERHIFRDGRWKQIKLNFSGKSDIPEAVPLGKTTLTSRFSSKKPKKDGPKFDKKNVYFEKKHLETIFSDVTQEIIKLVGSQMKSTKDRVGRGPKVLILVGGLGGNRYLYKRLEETYPNLPIIQKDPDEPITAICRGAVLKARSLTIDPAQDGPLDERLPRIRSRIPQLSYGISFFEEFDPRKHDSNDKVFHHATQKYIVDQLMHWLVKIDTDVLDAERPSYTFRRALESPQRRFGVDIWKCLSPVPPKSRRGRNDVVKFSKVSVSIDTPFYNLPLCADRKHREITFELDLDVSRFPMLSFVAKLNGQERGRRELKMDYA